MNRAEAFLKLRGYYLRIQVTNKCQKQMRINGPILDKEYQFPTGETLVSTTDLKGRILYCNGPFVTVSGFEKRALLGQPHNMIRHPDMPEEAFRDMWETIKSGSPWSAPVKNRRADGTHYWVIANVTPLQGADGPTGYMSVRTEATRNEIDEAETLYRKMRAEANQGKLRHRLSGGTVYVDSLPSRLGRSLTPSLASLLYLIVAVTCTVTFLAGTLAPRFFSDTMFWLSKIAIITVATAVVGYILNSLTLNRVKGLLAQVNRMAAGDLTVDSAKGRSDVIGQLQNGLVQLNVNLRSIVRDARKEAEQMESFSKEVAMSNENILSRTESQAAGIEETAAAMEQITSTVVASASAAADAADLANQAKAVADRSGTEVRLVSENMRSIKESSNQIGEIIQVIDSIAFQTNLLALNAAVEAARAGEQGRGFAVVASEVRELAKGTSTAAQQVKELVTESFDRVLAGSQQTESAQEAMDEALSSVSQVTELIHSISNSANEQRQAISEINHTINQMDAMTQQNASLVEQNASNSVRMQKNAEAVLESVGIFHLSSNDSSRSRPDAVALRKQAKNGS